MKKALVTGGLGFIGYEIVKELNKEGYIVDITDNRTTCREIFKTNDPKEANNVYDRITESLIDETYDVVMHLGMPSTSMLLRGVSGSILYNHSLDEMDTIIDYIREVGCRFIFASTSSLYKNSPELPYREDEIVIPFDNYTKLRYELENKAKSNLKSYVGLRLFSVYGLGEEHKDWFANVVTQMIKNKDFKLYGDGSQTRDFINVKDVVRAFMLAINHGNGIYNIGSGVETSFNQLSRLLGREPQYTNNPLGKDYVYRTWADTTKAERELGFKYKISLEEGIKEILDASK